MNADDTDFAAKQRFCGNFSRSYRFLRHKFEQSAAIITQAPIIYCAHGLLYRESEKKFIFLKIPLAHIIFQFTFVLLYHTITV